MIRALIFDFDGLILDTETPEYQSWADLFQAHGCELPLALWQSYIGVSWGAFDPLAYLQSLVDNPIAREQISQQRRQHFLALLETQPLQPGVESYLRGARRHGLHACVASSAPRAWVHEHLTQRELTPYFTTIKCGDDVAQAKPDPALYLAVLAELGLAAGEAIAFEDSPNGIAAANAAGIFCVAVPNPMTACLDLRHADLRLNSLDDVPLERLLTLVVS